MMRDVGSRWRWQLGVLCGGLLFSVAGLGQPGQPAPMQPSYSLQDSNLAPALPGSLAGVGISQRLGVQVPLNTVLRDEAGREVSLATYFQSGKPVLLAPVYYRCPMLCTQILSGMVSALRVLSLDPGKDFEVVAISFDPKDTAEIAAAKKENYLRRYRRPGTANGWHFLTGDEASVRAVTDAIGFHYKYDPKTDQYAHASGIMLLTPEGRVSKYFYGVEYSPRDIRLGLVEASNNRIGTPADEVLLFCFHYDPATGKYGAAVMNLLRITAGAFALMGGLAIVIALRRDARGRKRDLRQAGQVGI
jgi:protein SCO1/2